MSHKKKNKTIIHFFARIIPEILGISTNPTGTISPELEFFRQQYNRVNPSPRYPSPQEIMQKNATLINAPLPTVMPSTSNLGYQDLYYKFLSEGKNPQKAQEYALAMRMSQGVATPEEIGLYMQILENNKKQNTSQQQKQESTQYLQKTLGLSEEEAQKAYEALKAGKSYSTTTPPKPDTYIPPNQAYFPGSISFWSGNLPTNVISQIGELLSAIANNLTRSQVPTNIASSVSGQLGTMLSQILNTYYTPTYNPMQLSYAYTSPAYNFMQPSLANNLTKRGKYYTLRRSQ